MSPKRDRVTERWKFIKAGTEFDLIVTDVQMPGWTDGIALALWARSNHPHIKLVIVSGATDGSPALKGLGVEGVIIPKPYAVEAIALQAKELLNRGRQ